MRHFWSKFRHFYSFRKFCSQAKLRVLILNKTIIFSDSSPKIPKSDIFLSQIEGFLFLHHNLQQDIFENTDFKYDNSIFKFQSQNTQIKHFWSQIQRFLFFDEILQLDKFEGADFKYDNGFFEFQSEITQIKYFLS